MSARLFGNHFRHRTGSFISRASLVHSAISSCTNVVNSVGWTGDGDQTIGRERFHGVGIFQNLAIAWYMRAMMASGTFAGANIPVQPPLS